jgi:hypothetical protein
MLDLRRRQFLTHLGRCSGGMARNPERMCQMHVRGSVASVNKLLRGARPADLPVATAKIIGVAVPPTLLPAPIRWATGAARIAHAVPLG